MTPAPLTPNANPDNAVAQTLARVRPLLWQVSLVFSPVVNILVLTSSLYMMQVFDRVLSSQSQSTLFYLTLIAVGALALMSAVEMVRTRIMTRLGTWIEARLTAEGLQRAVEATLTGHPYRTELLRDLANLRTFFSTPSTLTLLDVPWIFVYLVVVYAIHPVLGHLTLIGAIGLTALAWWNDKVTHKDLVDSALLAQRNFRDADAAIRNAETLDVMGMTPGLLHRWRNENDRIQALQQQAADRGGNIMAVSKFLRQALQIMVLAVGAGLVLDRSLTSGGMIACSIIIARALAPVESAMSSWRQTLAAWGSYTRLKAVFEKPLLRAQSMALPRPKGNLSVEGVSYVPGGSKLPIIKGVSFAVKAGTVTAIVGPSAAGKSTLARLCVGAYAPTYGNVRLDGADVFLWERDNFAPHVGYLPQGVELFAGTVRENISRLMPAEPNEVVEAAQLAGAHDLILRLPQGYETEIGEGGAMLSAGQRQRIALARTVFRNPQYVVMDEPNSSLDAEGEDALNRAIAGLKQRGATVLVIGHRPGILAHADNIVVLRDGKVEMMGPKAEVMAKIMPQNKAAPAPAAAPKVAKVGEPV